MVCLLMMHYRAVSGQCTSSHCSCLHAKSRDVLVTSQLVLQYMLVARIVDEAAAGPVWQCLHACAKVPFTQGTVFKCLCRNCMPQPPQVCCKQRHACRASKQITSLSGQDRLEDGWLATTNCANFTTSTRVS